jgi:hypothetical protein
MIKLFSLKQQTKEGNNPQTTKKTSAAYLRVQKGRYNPTQPHRTPIANFKVTDYEW